MVRNLHLYFFSLILTVLTIVSMGVSGKLITKDVQITYEGVQKAHSVFKQVAPLLGLAAKELPFFIPVVGPYIGKALEVVQFIDKLDEHLNPEKDKNRLYLDSKFDGVEEKLNDIDGRIGNLIHTIPTEVARGSRIDDLKSIMGQIEAKYNSFQGLMSSDSATNMTTRFRALENFVLDDLHAKDLIDVHLKNMHTKLKDATGSVTDNVFDNLLSTAENHTLICGRKHSANVEIHVIYRDILTAFFQAMELTSLHCKVVGNKKTEAELGTHLFKCKLDLTTILRYLRDISLEVKKALHKSSRDYWKCDTSTDHNRIQLGPIFQTYFMSKKNAVRSGIRGEFPTFSGCESAQHDSCSDEYCQNQNHRVCHGNLRDCKSTGEEINICLNHRKDSRRYVYVETESKDIWGTKDESCEVAEHTLSHSFINKVCVCTCDEEFNAELDRYFNLHDVIADLQSNMVVTGVRFVKDKRLIHVQIQQAELGENGNVNQSTVTWKPIRKYNVFNRNSVMGKDYFKVTWDRRQINLDNLEVPANRLVTGVRFKEDNNKLKLEIQHTSFDFVTGKLDLTKSEWYSKPSKIKDQIRTKVALEKGLPKDEQGRRYQVYINYSQLSFDKSNLEKDLGSHVIPYLDSTDVAQSTPTPLSGVSLIHRQYEDSFGILGLKIVTYDFSSHFKVENASWPEMYSDHLMDLIKSGINSTQKVIST